MLRNVVEEIVRRRLWPIPVAAIAVVVAAPLLFLKPAPREASPAGASAPAPSAQTDLPARAQRLLATTDAPSRAGRRLSRSARDPFRAPASQRAATPGAGAGAGKSSSKKASTKSPSDSAPVPVVVTNPDGSTPAAPSTSPATPSGGDGGTATTRSSEPSDEPTVDVRFGARKDSPIKRAIPRLKTFEVDGRVVVVFVKYSPSRDKAVFAIEPTTTVRGDIDCRRKQGVCRYVDIPAGRYARLTFVAGDGSRVSRRLDVVRINGRS